MKRPNNFHAPLHSRESEKQTVGGRHTNPDICSRYDLPRVCAFASSDKMCLAPPKSWPKQFRKLDQERSGAHLHGKQT
mgnify:CR=1 FL=1